MKGQIFEKGDIIVVDPGEAADFQVLEDALTVVVKIPSAIGDKHLV